MSKVCQHGWMVWGGVTRSVGALEGGSVYLVASKAVSTPPESLTIICICLCLYNLVASKAAINPSPNSRVPSTPPSKLVSIHSHQIVRRDSLNPQSLIHSGLLGTTIVEAFDALQFLIFEAAWPGQ